MAGEIDKFVRELARAPERVAADLSSQMLREARNLSHVDTGKMRAGWGVRAVQRGSVYVLTLTNDREYAAYQDPDVPSAVLRRLSLNLSENLR